jgi:hypothetical protein
MVKSELLNAKNDMCFILRKTPVVHILATIFKENNIRLVLFKYSGFSCLLANRDDYIFDVFIKEVYFNNPLFYAFKVLRDLLLFVVNSFCYQKLGKSVDVNFSRVKNNAAIGVDKYLNLAEDDCFWFKGSQIDPTMIYYFEERKPSNENIEYLTRNKIRRIHIVNNPVAWLKKNANHSREARQLFSAEWGGIERSLSYVKLWFKGVSFRDTPHKWKTLMLLQLQTVFMLWKSVFQQLGIKMLISLSEIDSMKTAKMMAANLSNGAVFTGHLSNNQLNYVLQERFYHIVFVWGPHFYSHIFERCADKTVVVTGYYLDYKFKDYNVKANKIRMKYPDKFILTFMDNSFFQDIPYSIETMRKVYGLFFDIIDLYPQVILFVKTKRAEIFNKTRRVIPTIDKYINRGKIVPFIKDTDTNQSYKPALIALASDLVIGLGINSAATESQFAGVPSFHFDLSKTEDNRFARNGLGTIVFQSVESMREAIERQINLETALPYDEIDHFYNDLDPFRDGRAAERIGSYMKWLLDGFNAGLSCENAIRDAAVRYCSEWGYDKVISLPHHQSEYLGFENNN